MARARIEYQFGQLVEIEEKGSEQVENIKEKFKGYGIYLPLLADGDLSTAKSFLQCLGLWTGKQSNFNQLQKKYVIPLKGNSARRLENVSKNGLRKSFSLNSLDKLYKNEIDREIDRDTEDNQGAESENDQENTEGPCAGIEKMGIEEKVIKTVENKSQLESTGKNDEEVTSTETPKSDKNNDSINSFEIELGEDILVKDQSDENTTVTTPEIGAEITTEVNLDDPLEDGEIVEDELEVELGTDEVVKEGEEDTSIEEPPEEPALKAAMKVTETKIEESTGISKEEPVELKIEPKKERKHKAFETKWPKVEKVERRRSLDCLELLAKEMISNDFLKTARAIMKMKKEETGWKTATPKQEPRKQEFKIEISKKETVQSSNSSQHQSNPHQFNQQQAVQSTAINFYPTEDCLPSTSKQSFTTANALNLPTYKDATDNRLKTGSKPEDKDTRICMVTPHVQKRSNPGSNSQKSSSQGSARANKTSRPPIIVLDDEKEPIHDLVEPQIPSPIVSMSALVASQPSHLSFPSKSGLQIGGYQPMIPTVLPHSTVLAHRRPDARGPSSRVRLTVEALEALLAVPDRFQRIDFGDGKGHLFKKSAHSDKNRFPNGEFFAAKINEQEHYFISLQIENGADCGLDYPCHRRDCPIHITPQFKIGYQCVKGPQVNGFQYRIIRVWHPPNKEVPKSELNRETHLTPMDSQNFNAYILQKLGCSPSECERRIKGKNVPIMVIHALVQLRETFNSMTKTDWKEMLIELEIMPKWTPKMMTGRMYTEHKVDGKNKLYDRSGYLIELERHVDEMKNFYATFKHIIKDISIQKQAVYQKPTVRNSTIPLYKLEKRQKTSLPSFQ